MKFRVWTNSLTIFDCYEKYDKAFIKETLNALRAKYSTCNAFKRSDASLMREWRAHARAYKLGFLQEHSKDCTMEYPLKWYYEVLFFIFGI